MLLGRDQAYSIADGGTPSFTFSLAKSRQIDAGIFGMGGSTTVPNSEFLDHILFKETNDGIKCFRSQLKTQCCSLAHP